VYRRLTNYSVPEGTLVPPLVHQEQLSVYDKRTVAGSSRPTSGTYEIGVYHFVRASYTTYVVYRYDLQNLLARE